MKKLLILPFLFCCVQLSAQVILLAPKGKLISFDTTTHALSIVGNYVIATCDTCISFDSTKVVTNITKNATLDSFNIYKGETLSSTLKDNIGTSVDSLKHLFIDTSASPRNGYVLTFDSTNHKWYLSAGGSGVGGISVTSFSKNATRDSAILVLSDGSRYAVKDSINSYWLPTTGGIYSSSGKHGINTSTPQNDLDIKGTANSWMLNVGNDVSTNGTGWAGISLGESFGVSAVRKTGIVYRRTGSTGEGDMAIISKRSGSGNATYTDVHTNFGADGAVVINNGYNKNYFSILSAYDTSRGIRFPAQTTAQIQRNAGGVVSLSVLSGGSGYTGTSYTSATPTGGSGTGLKLSGTISAGAVTSATTTDQYIGLSYRTGDTVYANFNSGTGASFIITSVGSPGNFHYDSTTNQIAVDLGNNNVTGLVTVSSASTLSLLYGGDYIFTGTTTTWTLPTILSNTKGRQNSILIKNRGSGSITLNAASGSTIYTTSAVSTITIVAGAACELVADGTYFNVMYNN